MIFERKNILLIIFFTFLVESCGFYSLSGSLPPHIKTISIPMVENETAEFGIAENISDGMLLTILFHRIILSIMSTF